MFLLCRKLIAIWEAGLILAEWTSQQSTVEGEVFASPGWGTWDTSSHKVGAWWGCTIIFFSLWYCQDHCDWRGNGTGLRWPDPPCSTVDIGLSIEPTRTDQPRMPKTLLSKTASLDLQQVTGTGTGCCMCAARRVVNFPILTLGIQRFLA